MMSRREFLQLSATVGMLSKLGGLRQAEAASDYKALVCLFMFGGNDGHNLVVPLDATQYAAYQKARGALALPLGHASLWLRNAAGMPVYSGALNIEGRSVSVPASVRLARLFVTSIVPPPALKVAPRSVAAEVPR